MCNDKKVLILVQAYPKLNGEMSLMFVHTRNKYYLEQGIEPIVLNFNADSNYILDGIQVISYEEYKKNEQKYSCNILISHAPNLRSHYKFLTLYGKNFKKFMFFFHGHEVLKYTKEYPKLYSYMKRLGMGGILRDLYDDIKLYIWRKFFVKNREKSVFIFVSNWLKSKFFYYTKIDEVILGNKCYVINNSVGKIFEKNDYVLSESYLYDFITIRSNLDGATYAIDMVNNLAKCNPDLRFLIIGRGKFFNFYPKARNVEWIDRSMTHEEIVKYLNCSKCGLMPTRNDTQGVMACEMATYGIPVITSDIAVCREIFSDYNHVELITNDDYSIDLLKIVAELRKKMQKRKKRYVEVETVYKEVELIKQLGVGDTF